MTFPCVGLDFGTSNSAIATALPGAPPELIALDPARSSPTFPSILYFERGTDAGQRRVVSSAGPEAIRRYLDAETKGRLMQSLKAYLADRRFDGTAVLSQHFTLEDLVSRILWHMARAAATSIVLPSRVVVGRPVHFSNARTKEDDDFAVERLGRSLALVGFDTVAFEYEPVAAAYAYEQRLTSDELILIGDFGGGTSDFSIIRVGPDRRRRTESTEARVIGNDGVATAGDAFDKQIIRHVVAPRLGMGSQFISPPNKFLTVPNWPYAHLERWHHLSFLRSSEALEMLERIQASALLPERIESFIHLITSEAGFQLHRAVQRTKFDLSEQDRTLFEFDAPPVTIRAVVTRADFEGWIAEELAEISTCVDRLLTRTGTAPSDIDRVFLTGGSSFVPAVRRIFVDRFGAQKITGGNELTSVANGLALCALERWGADPTARPVSLAGIEMRS